MSESGNGIVRNDEILADVMTLQPAWVGAGTWENAEAPEMGEPPSI